MDKLGEIISCIQYFRESCDPMEQKLAEKLTLAIALLRAGASMYRDLDSHEAGYTAGQNAWDAALEGEDEQVT